MSTERATFARRLIIVLLALVVVSLYSSFRRPLWIDEFLHFAFGGLPSFTTALEVVRETTEAVNHGQTGTYFLINYFSLQAFGADFLALRWPSIASAFLLLIFAAIFIAQRGLGGNWQILVIVALSGQVGLMYFAGEARSYMPLAAAVVGTLTYYSGTIENRSRFFLKFIGWSSVMIGVTMHPYFFLYWPVIVLFSYSFTYRAESKDSGLRQLLRFANPRLVLTGSLVGLSIGFFTWMRAQPDFNRDPFENVRPRGGLWRVLSLEHLQFLPTGGLGLDTLSGVFIVILLVLIITRRSRKLTRLNPLIAPLALLALALALSVVLSAISFLNSYWILPRQWVASAALAPISLVWLVGVLTQITKPIRPGLALVITFLFSAVLLVSGLNRLNTQYLIAQSDITQFNEWRSQDLSDIRNEYRNPISNEQWVILGNNNVIFGGPVWPEVASYYGYEPPNAEK